MVGLATRALTSLSLHATQWTKQRPFPSPPVLLSRRLERYYGHLRRPPGSPPTSRLLTGYRARRSGASPQPPGRGGPPQFPPPPSFWAFRALYAGRFLGAAPPGSSP